MKRKDITHIKPNYDFHKARPETATYETSEGISIKKEYTKEDIAKLEHLDFVAGIALTYVVLLYYVCAQAMDRAAVRWFF